MVDYDKVFVTGGNGLVGSCVKGKHRPKSSEVNLLDFKQTLDYMKTIKLNTSFTVPPALAV